MRTNRIDNLGEIVCANTRRCPAAKIYRIDLWLIHLSPSFGNLFAESFYIGIYKLTYRIFPINRQNIERAIAAFLVTEWDVDVEG